MTDQLVSKDKTYSTRDGREVAVADAREAADRIEAQDRLLALTGKVNVGLMELSIEQKASIAALEKRNAELQAALRYIAANTCCGSCQEAAKAARAALEEKKDD